MSRTCTLRFPALVTATLLSLVKSVHVLGVEPKPLQAHIIADRISIQTSQRERLMAWGDLRADLGTGLVNQPIFFEWFPQATENDSAPETRSDGTGAFAAAPAPRSPAGTAAAR